MVDTSGADENQQTLYSVLKASVARTREGPGPCSLKSLKLHWAYSSVGLEHTPDKREVGSSNLPRPTSQVVGGRS